MWNPWDVALAVVIALGMPLRAAWRYRHLRALPEAAAGRGRIAAYRQAMLAQWSLVAALGLLWWTHERTAAALGLTLRLTPGLVGVLLGFLFILPALLRQRLMVREDPALRARLAGRLAGAERILPRTDREHAWFVPLALTAGVCEELLFRGFLVWFGTRALPELASHAAVAVLFGLAHAYQGRSGMLRTGLVGAFFSLVVWVSGSVVPAMVLHAVVDLLAGDLGRHILSEPDAAASGA